MNPQLTYLREVLGIENWISSPAESTAAQIEPASKSSSVAEIRIKTNWTAAERALVEKIITAGGLHALPTVARGSNASHLIVFDSAEPVSRLTSETQVIWNLGSLRSLLDGDSAAVQAAKRDVWNLLKRMKEETGL